jgi:branched-chain amino acid transport system ATP-binding protein
MTEEREPILAVEGLRKRFGGIVALAGVDLRVAPDEAVALIGPNGAGKTTLFDCVSGLYRPDAGTIRFAGKRIDQMPVYRRARLGIGRTFQRAELFAHLSVREHLLVAERSHVGDGRVWKDLLGRGRPSPAELDRVEAVIAELDLAAIADAPAESLSLGQGRLVELGRALIGDPELLLLDEPSSGLDATETADLANVLRQTAEERSCALLLVEHDLDLVRALAQRVIVLDSGKVVAEGTLDAVMAEEAVRGVYLGQVV